MQYYAAQQEYFCTTIHSQDIQSAGFQNATGNHIFPYFLCLPTPETTTENFIGISRRNRRLLEACQHFPHFPSKFSVNRVIYEQIDLGSNQTALVNAIIPSPAHDCGVSSEVRPSSIPRSIPPTTGRPTAVYIDHREPSVHPFNGSPHIYSCGGMSKRNTKIPPFHCLPASNSFTHYILFQPLRDACIKCTPEALVPCGKPSEVIK